CQRVLGSGFALLLSTWVSCVQKVEQSPPSLRVQEGEKNTAFNCNYSNSASTNLQWFRQDPEKGLITLFYLASEGKQKGRLRSTINRKERHSSLHISAAQLEDSGTYLCAAEPQ
uniref:Ig-like domain-containing protein n=1 Tax=Vombatus ursinus TaxID=29139 RepID=A0A4X2LYJ3_VOMUR